MTLLMPSCRAPNIRRPLGFMKPAGIAITPDGKTAYVANQASGTVTVINTRTNTVEKTIKVGAGPWSIAATP